MTALASVASRTQVSHAEMANAIRFLAIDAVEKAKSGHPGMPMGMADVATVLFSRFLKFDPDDPAWPDRDRFVLSAGHGSMLLYALLHLTGYEGVTLDQLKAFRQWGSATPGHPEYGHTPGVETTTGPLGQGIATAVGMALAERLMNARFGDELVDHFTYVIAGDGCLMEGISHEAISLAGHLRLNRLIVLFDDNRISIDGATSLSCSDHQLARFRASGWSACRIDGHDPQAVARAIDEARKSDLPSLIACQTVIGFGAPNREGSEKVHGAPLGSDEVAKTRAALDWRYEPFEVPPAVLAEWREIGARGRAARRAWIERSRSACNGGGRSPFHDALNKKLPGAYTEAMAKLKERFAAERPKLATRQASQQVIDVIAEALPNLLGGSADLTHSNLTLAKSQVPVRSGWLHGSYIHYGVREHAMAAAMNGIALHGGFVPYGGTFLAFADYSRPAIRLAALMGVRVIHVMTHDSIGLGEDGPTHQPVEHLAALRAIPNLLVFRPADPIETAEAWDCALKAETSPSILCLSRQALTAFRDVTDTNHVALGAYVAIEPDGGRDVTLIATGSEVSIALEAAKLLGSENVRAAVVSAPCFDLFRKQPRDYQAKVLGDAPRVGVEAAIEGDWARWLGDDGEFVGMNGFGASAPADVLYREFGITPAAVAAAARRVIQHASERK
ncbi:MULTISPECIES: transketolase [unclassified Bradyrhizobium]